MWGGCREAKSNLERQDTIRWSERLALLSVGTTRWRSGTNTSAVTSTCWLNTTSCTVVQLIWLTVGGSYTNTHADCYPPPALHGGDQLAGNEAEKHWRMCAVLWKHCKFKLIHTYPGCHTLVGSFTNEEECDFWFSLWGKTPTSVSLKALAQASLQEAQSPKVELNGNQSHHNLVSRNLPFFMDENGPCILVQSLLSLKKCTQWINTKF